MTDDELDALTSGIAEAFVDEMALLRRRLEALEQRQIVHGRDGVNGRDGLTVKGDVGETGPAGRNGTDGRDGRDVSPEEVRAIVDELVSKALAAMPAPKDGRDGVGVTLDEVRPVIAAEVTKAVDALPQPKNGLDGVGVASGLVDRNGDLHLTLTDGTVKNIGRVVGANGGAGEKGERGEAGQSIQGPPGEKGMDGGNGRDGKDGATLDFDDLQAAEYDGKRTVTLKFQRGEHVKTFPIKFAVPLYEDVWTPKTYEPGDMVTYAGGLWITKAETLERPGNGATSWRLVAKKGHDGKTGPPGQTGPQGPRGDRGDKW